MATDMTTRTTPHILTTEENVYVDLTEMRALVSRALNYMSAHLIARAELIGESSAPENLDPVTKRLQQSVGKLGQIAAGLAVIDPECLPAAGAGFGSTVSVMDTETGERDEYVLMVGSLVDIEANHVSLASPIGQALMGRRAGEQIRIATPLREVTLVITSVTTLLDFLETDAIRWAPA
jgi:transcription elongation factor GreA